MTFGKLFDQPANIVVPFLLFILLSPGLLFTLPEKSSSMVEKVLTHAVLFLVVYSLLRLFFSSYY